MPSDSNRCRLALVTTELRVGGAEKCLAELATRLDQRRYDIRVFSLAPPPPPPRDRLWNKLVDASVSVESLNLRSVWQYRRGVSRLKQAWSAWCPNIVQSFLFHADLISARVAKLCDIENLMLGLRVAEPRRGRGWLEERASRRASKVVCVSRQVAEDAVGRLKMDPAKIVVIPNGVDWSTIDSAQAADLQAIGVPPERIVVSLIGRLERQKGIDRLLDKLASFFQRNRQAHLLIVGEGTEHDQLVAQVDRLGLTPHVTFASWQDEVGSILKASRLLVLPSRYEGMPNVVLDAMAAGRPAVCFDVEGVHELLGDRHGQVVKQGELGDFVAAMERFIGDEAWALRVGKENSEIARDRFSIDAMVARYDSLYQAEFESRDQLDNLT